MGKLPKYTASYYGPRCHWQLTRDGSNTVIRTFETKREVTTAGVLREAVGPEGGSVKILTIDGRTEMQRTYPRLTDPVPSIKKS